jgi:hypothetical protein
MGMASKAAHCYPHAELSPQHPGDEEEAVSRFHKVSHTIVDPEKLENFEQFLLSLQRSGPKALLLL